MKRAAAKGRMINQTRTSEATSRAIRMIRADPFSVIAITPPQHEPRPAGGSKVTVRNSIPFLTGRMPWTARPGAGTVCRHGRPDTSPARGAPAQAPDRPLRRDRDHGGEHYRIRYLPLPSFRGAGADEPGRGAARMGALRRSFDVRLARARGDGGHAPANRRDLRLHPRELLGPPGLHFRKV